MDQVEAFILAGGASSRMGTDKAQLLIAEQSLIQRIANTLFQLFSSVTIVGREVDDPRLKTTTDVYPNWGALGGVHGALDACAAEWAFVIACDLPFVSKEMISSLLKVKEGSDAVAPVQPDTRPQPLSSLYKVTPCREVARQLIEAGKRRPLDLLDRVNTRWVPFSELSQLTDSQNFFLNINTPEDYYEATQRAANKS